MSVDDIPGLNAILNSIAIVLLVCGYGFIRRGDRLRHRYCMLSAFVVSAFFLVGYVTHKILVRGVHTPFEGEGVWRLVYFPMLVTHILLAIVIVPLILVTMTKALRGNDASHKRWARWTFPIWMYVSVTGVLIYFFLYRWFV